jgi:enamine deaminase RidA (YjgF/YER057c/UK114 family)
MKILAVNAQDAPAAMGGYAQAIDLVGVQRLLIVSGQIPVAPDGHVPSDFDGQCRLVWANIGAQLRAAGLDYSHLVKVTTYLSDRRFGDANGAIRREILGAYAPALTVVIAGIYDEKWLLEIEAMAAA